MTELELEPRALPAGALAVTSITLDGVAVPLAGVLANVTIRHGRAGYFDSASPSTAQLSLLGVTRSFTRPFRLGSLLVINATDGSTVARRFTGRLTDADLVGDELVAIAVGALRTLSGYTVGTVDYPEEKWSSRVQRAFGDAGLAPVLELDEQNNPANWTGSGAVGGGGVDFPDGVFWYPAGNLAPYSDAVGVAPGALVPAASLPLDRHYELRFELIYTAPAFAGAGLYVNVDNGITTIAQGFVVLAAGHSLRIPFTLTELGPSGLGFTVILDRTVPPANWLLIDRVSLVDVAPYKAGRLELQAGAFDPLLVARPAEPVSLAQYLDELTTTVESAVADLPDGRILVQAVSARATAAAVALDPAEVAYSPAWEIRLPPANIVTVRYGEPEASITVTDAASVALYGPIAVDLATDLKTLADATATANARLARGAYAHWEIPAAALLYGRRLELGRPAGLSSLPASAPYAVWSPVLEGWTDSIVSDGEELVWTMELALSDPLRSGIATLSWATVPATAAYHWNTINPAVAWRDALALDDLTP